jgi:hypothetical protein
MLQSLRQESLQTPHQELMLQSLRQESLLQSQHLLQNQIQDQA